MAAERITRSRRLRAAPPEAQAHLLLQAEPVNDGAKPLTIRRVSRPPRPRKDPSSACTTSVRLPRFSIDWGRALSWKFSIFMVSSYLYYHMNRSIIPDTDYDRLAVELLEGYDRVSHIHKKYVTRRMLEAGTAYSIKSYPRMVVGAALRMLEEYQEV